MESIKTYQEGECYVLEAPRDPANIHEMKVFNPDYFKDLGFPNATISIVGEETNAMVGGYYEKPEELTWPFRQFVYMVQPTTTVATDNTSATWFPEIKGPGFYEQVVGTKPEESMFDKLMGKVKTFFSSEKQTPSVSEEPKSILDMEPVQVSEEKEPIVQAAETNTIDMEPAQAVENPKSILDMEPVQVSEEKEPIVQIAKETNTVEEPKPIDIEPVQVLEEQAPSVSEMGTKWLVRFCKEPADESTENQIIRQYRANKMRGITMTNTATYKIWNVEIKLGVVSQGESALEISGPEGSQGYKWSFLK